MIQDTLLTSAIFSLVSAVVYGLVGFQLSRRVVGNAASNFAWKLFTLWWFSLAVSTLTGFIFNLMGAIGRPILPVFVALTYANLLIICIALWALLYYLIYLFTGKPGILIPLSAFYLIYFVLLVYYITVSTPNGVEVGRWTTSLKFLFPLSGPLIMFILLLLVLPQILGSLAYLTLFFRVEERTQKYRILLVSLSLVIWFGLALVAPAIGIASEDWWQVASRAIGLGAALVILMAYRPPGFIQRRLAVASIMDEGEENS
jgi:hypothetical protein